MHKLNEWKKRKKITNLFYVKQKFIFNINQGNSLYTIQVQIHEYLCCIIEKSRKKPEIVYFGAFMFEHDTKFFANLL